VDNSRSADLVGVAMSGDGDDLFGGARFLVR
jgi:hypothetical protein